MAHQLALRRSVWLTGTAILLVIAALTTGPGRNLAGRLLSSLRMQKVQAVNADFTPFVDGSANATLHQMVTQMISDNVQVEVNESDQPVADAAAASRIAGFHVLLLTSRKDAPKLIVGGAHKVDMSVGPTNANSAIASNITGPTPATTQYSDCVRLREGPAAKVTVPHGLDVGNLAEIGLETAGMTPGQARDFLQTVDWKAALSLNVPRFLRSYEEVRVAGTLGTLLSMAGRRGPGYALIWTKDGVAYSLTGFGDSSQAISLANSVE